VAQDGNGEHRARARAWTWPVGVRPSLDVWRPRPEFALATQLRQWVRAEVTAGRLLPWLAVAYGFGIVIYFTAEREPVWQAAVALAVACVICTVLLRRHLVDRI
jgi:hypothetical protein